MRILIVGAGEIGIRLCKLFSHEHDLTVVEADPQRAVRAREQADAIVLEGNGGSYSLLKEAGIHQAKVVAALTDNDELNLMICQMAKRAGVSITVARVRNYEYTRPDFIIPRFDLGPDLIIHPEKETAAAIIRLMRQSMATDVVEFEKGALQLIGLRIEDNSPVLRQSLRQISEEYAHLNMRIVAIRRKDRTLIPGGDDILVPRDQVFFVCEPHMVDEVVRLNGKSDRNISNVMILGGGLIGQFIAMDSDRQFHLKIVESNADKSQKIAERLDQCLVIHGSGTDIDLLAAEGITDMDAFIAVTGSDETNIIATLVARHLQVPRTIALVNNSEYMPITPTIGMDAVVSKELITVNAIEQFIHHRQVASVVTIPGVDAHIIEYIASSRSRIIRKSLMKTSIPRGAIFGAIMREEQVIIPRGDTTVQAGDKVVVFSLPSALAQVERLFK